MLHLSSALALEPGSEPSLLSREILVPRGWKSAANWTRLRRVVAVLVRPLEQLFTVALFDRSGDSLAVNYNNIYCTLKMTANSSEVKTRSILSLSLPVSVLATKRRERDGKNFRFV